MMSRLLMFMWGSLFLFFVSGRASQPNRMDLNTAVVTCQNDLIAAGLENIEIQVASGPTIWISYENRRFRNEVLALGVVLVSSAHRFSSCHRIVLIPKYRNVTIKYIIVEREGFEQWLQDQISLTEFLAGVSIGWYPLSPAPYPGYIAPERQSSAFKFDLSFIPGCNAQFAQPKDPAQLQFNVTSNISFTVAKGFQMNGQLYATIYDEFQRFGHKNQTGFLQIQQLIRLPYQSFLSLSAGRFEFGCYGISSQLRHFLWRDRVSFSARIDWVDAHSIGQWLSISRPISNRYSYLFQTDYRFEPVDVHFRVSWGRYLLGDSGWRIDIMRRFRELELEFMGVWSQSLEFLTGMTVRIPFPMIRQAMPSRFRLTSPRSIIWDYRYLPCYDGLILNTGESFERVADQLTLSFIRANSHYLKIARRYVKLDEAVFRHEYIPKRGS
ncbi:MAG: YjbH domain-containing protein [candidate division KSB1 bacterium]|nr:YjbH domain-containing protein [candidate division KSB1 bacterium]MDZ7336757.1 YjbH domain-containing protein [candidate division KSB1 bacterium]